MNLEALKTVNSADVYVAGQFAGTLTREAGSHTTFTYDPNYRGHPVASTLQVGPAPVTAHGGAVPPFLRAYSPKVIDSRFSKKVLFRLSRSSLLLPS